MIHLPLSLSRLFVQSLGLAVSQIWANKTRAVLTTIGIVIGVSSVIAVVAAVNGMRAFVLDEFESMGSNKMFIYPDAPRTGRRRYSSHEVFKFKPEHVEGMLQACPSLDKVTRIGSWGDVVRSSAETEEVGVVGIEPDWHTIENRSVTIGRPFSYVDEKDARFVCLITPTLRDKLQLDRDPTGQIILVGDYSFQIVGIVEAVTESSMFGSMGRRSEDVFIPLPPRGSSANRSSTSWPRASKPSSPRKPAPRSSSSCAAHA